LQLEIAGLPALQASFTRLIALGERPRPLWDAIGQYGETSTRLRFKNQAGPDGVKWKPSKRAKKTGGDTLKLRGHLLGSITYTANNSGAEWGSNKVYARIHQFGGTIKRLAFSSTLRLRTGKGGSLLRQKDRPNLSVFAKATHRRAVNRRYTVGAHTINMPARPYLGVNAQDGIEMVHISEQYVALAAANRGET
jgi:phage virion morphogenesis protein